MTSNRSDTTGQQLRQFIADHPRLLVLTGAGVSTDCGIPDYRDARGNWKRAQPVQHSQFMSQHPVRQRYWARSLVGWPVIRDARPGVAHHCLARLEQQGHIVQLVTQNVDRLHQRAGSRRVIDLHGRSDHVRCMQCHTRYLRERMHQHSALLNPGFSHYQAPAAPDGDADLMLEDFSQFRIPGCPRCDGILKPDVVFFGDQVPAIRVERARQALQQADALLVIGSSLMVYSGYRFCKWAHQQQTPICVLTRGHSRADPLVSLKLDADVSTTLATATE